MTIRLCREGVYFLVIMGFVLGGALMRQINLLMILFGLMAGPLLFNAWYAWTTPRGLRVRRRAPDPVAAGDPLVVELELENVDRPGGAWAILVEDRLQLAGAAAEPLTGAVLFTVVPHQQTRRAAYRGVLTRRGRYRLGPLRVSTRFPFGLVRSTITLEDEPREFIVLPRLGELTHRWTQIRHEAYQRTRVQKQRQGMFEGDFHNLRPWRSGDSRRWIHWRTTARRGELMVRQFEQQLQRDLALIVELWEPPKPDPAHRDNVELAVSFAASICAQLCRRGGCQLYLAVAGREVMVFDGPASPAIAQTAMTRLAVAEATATDNLPKTLADSLGTIPAGTHIVLVSTRAVDVRDTSRFAELWKDPRRRAALTHVLTINTSSGELQRYFQPE